MKRPRYDPTDPVIPYHLSDRLYNQRTFYFVLGLWLFVGAGMATQWIFR